MTKQLNIQVTRINKKKPGWAIRITDSSELPYARYFLPEFTSWGRASRAAESLAQNYRFSGYDVALDTKTCRKRNVKYAASYCYP